MVYLFSHFSDVCAWVFLGFLQLLLIGISTLCYKFYFNSRAATEGTTNSDEVFGHVEDNIDELSYWFLFAGIIATIISICYCVIVFFKYKHIKTAINILEVSAEFIINHKRIMVVVVCCYIFILASFFLWMYIMILILSLNDI